ncbi:glycyl-tRNA synthetase-like protein [Microthyrium microscopicum]|uniref:glycine--tRNA ligase n=1 Tax=Microthyrium microscopicum TaxID=703497 RepID=A0A6A6U9T6_9PEZI|nr:glycyl-tRNA synthetase-like protein [Microthyrium microscopicum]
MAPPMTTKTGEAFNREQIESLFKRRFFFGPAFEIHEPVKGLFDYGPPLTAIQANFVNLWRKFFVNQEKMLEVDPTILSPYKVLKTSGHVDKFADWCTKDPKSGEIFRADHLVEQVLENRLRGDEEARGETAAPVEADADGKRKKKLKTKQVAIKLDDAVRDEYKSILAQIDNYGGPELGQLMVDHKIKNPDTGGDLEPPVEFNLMFQTQIGPVAGSIAYLRPETAQGQFLNFNKLLEYNNQQMPFASASIGKSFRNEISPRSGLLRVREFLMAEIEHFVDPEGGKKHAKFSKVAHIELELLNRQVQLDGRTDIDRKSIGDAVKEGIVDNETLGYFLARVQMFMETIGIDQKKIRFRQHMANEMAHYATDCWDCELLTSYGWIECVGCADRSAYDLTVHSKATNTELCVKEKLPKPLEIEEWVVDVDKKKFGPKFKKDAKAIETALDSLSQELREKLSLDLSSAGKIKVDVPSIAAGSAEVEKDLVKIEKRKRMQHTREYVPNVIEPSFGIGRILYALLEHSYWTREGDEARGVISLPTLIAPTKVLVCPLFNMDVFRPIVNDISDRLDIIDISHLVDSSGASIGKRYSRNDELGTPFGITVDYQSVQDNTVTLRERDTTKQVRASVDEIIDAIKLLTDGKESWESILRRLPLIESKEESQEASQEV